MVGAERFLAEIKTTANLQHPHILPLFDSGQADGVMAHIEWEKSMSVYNCYSRLSDSNSFSRPCAEAGAGHLWATQHKGEI